MYRQPLPSRVRVLIIGGGIHGVGVLHDLSSRGWKDVHLVEKTQIGTATSSRSTKLIHGGLRYLRNIGDFPLVAEALRERKTLMALAPDLVQPLELYLPLPISGGMPAPILRTGLWLYDFLAGQAKIQSYRTVSPAEALAKAPILNIDATRRIFSYWDAQTDDLALVRRVAASAVRLGGGISEQAQVLRIIPSSDGWQVEIDAGGQRQVVSARYVLNAAGPWANILLNRSGLRPAYEGVNSEGIHLVFPDVGLKVGMFLQDPKDHRIFFVVPWLGKTLVGTTEDLYDGDPDQLRVRREPVEYLLERSRHYLKVGWQAADIEAQFTGLRWLAANRSRDLSSTSRADLVSEQPSGRGVLYTIYGGKLTSYRSLAKTIADRILKHFGEATPSRTHLADAWLKPSEAAGLMSDIPGMSRFLPGGIVYNPSEGF